MVGCCDGRGDVDIEGSLEDELVSGNENVVVRERERGEGEQGMKWDSVYLRLRKKRIEM
jgi:hypothetical protein